MDLTPEIRTGIRAYLMEVRTYLDSFDGLLDSDQLAEDDFDLSSKAENRLKDLRYGYLDRLELGEPTLDPRDDG